MPQIERRDDIGSAYVRSASHTVLSGSGTLLMQPDGLWDFAFLRNRQGLQALRTGLTTRPVEFTYADGDEILAIGFAASAFMPAIPGDAMRDRGVLLPRIGADRFRIGAEIFEVPRLDNVEDFVARLTRREAIGQNPLVASIVSGRPNAATERTMQRHFLRTTGLTIKAFSQIARAQKAVARLEAGEPAADVAYALGYADQPHLIRSMRAIMGRTPRQIAAAAAGSATSP
jgi:hypothetical protein